MKKNQNFKKALVATMVALGSLTAATDALACRRWDVGCKIREAAKRAREAAEREAQRLEEARRAAQQQAQVAADLARKQAEEAARIAAEQAAAAKAAEEAALKKAQEEALRLAEVAKRQLPIQPSEVMNLANNRANLIANTAKGTAFNAYSTSMQGMTRVGNDINSAFKNVGDELESELKKLNVAIPDVAEYAQLAMKPALSELKSWDSYRRVVMNGFDKLSKDEIGTIWSVMRSVIEGKRPSDDDVEDLADVFKVLFGDMTNGCAICPSKPTRSAVGIGITITSPSLGNVPVSASLSFDLKMSTYPVSNGKPLFVAGYTVTTQATVQPSEGDISLDVVWAPGELQASKIPEIALGVGVTLPGIESTNGSIAGGGSVNLKMPDTVFMFFDKGERRKLLAALKDPSKGPTYVVSKANQAINDLKTMIMNPEYDAGIAVSPPGKKLAVSPPDGALKTSIGGSIISF